MKIRGNSSSDPIKTKELGSVKKLFMYCKFVDEPNFVKGELQVIDVTMGKRQKVSFSICKVVKYQMLHSKIH